METLINYFSRLAGYEWWRVAIQLFLIGLVVYWAVDFLEGTRGERLFRAVLTILIAGVLILNLVVERFHFEVLAFLYRGFLIGVLIIAVAAFQPEIRRALIRIGQLRLPSSSSQMAGALEEITAAVTGLSASEIGAIIVIERQVALGEFIETGVKIDARVTAELLKTIFQPGTPLHDMAVIIRADRVVAARVQLPLAEAGSIDGVELGSRHRAAVGITADSDAVCLVVSEETGSISIAQGGKLTLAVNESELKKRLAGILEEMLPITERLRKLPRKSRIRNHKDYA